MASGKAPRLPSIGPNTKLLSFDLETNGLHGEAFAVGAVLIDATGRIISKFTARCPLNGLVNEWVQANVFPVITDMPETQQSPKELREAFWAWYLHTEPEADYVLVANGYPVEYRFLLQCQEDDLDTRYWQHPFPILDLTSVVLASGHDPSAKGEFISRIVREGNYARHNPVDDAIIAALVAFKAFKLS